MCRIYTKIAASEGFSRSMIDDAIASVQRQLVAQAEGLPTTELPSNGIRKAENVKRCLTAP